MQFKKELRSQRVNAKLHAKNQKKWINDSPEK